MVQLVTSLASALTRWGDGPPGYVMWPFVVVKMLVVGVVYMHRLDDRRMVRAVDGGDALRWKTTSVIPVLTCHWITTLRTIHCRYEKNIYTTEPHDY